MNEVQAFLASAIAPAALTIPAKVVCENVVKVLDSFPAFAAAFEVALSRAAVSFFKAAAILSLLLCSARAPRCAMAASFVALESAAATRFCSIAASFIELDS